MTTIPSALVTHLKRVYPDMVAASYPQPFEEVLEHFQRGTWDLLDDGRSHWLLSTDPRCPHRASVSVAVEPEMRGHGCGLYALNAAFEAARQAGRAYVDGWLWADNTAAFAMDMRAGFEVVGSISDAWRYPDGKSRTMLLVTKRLT